MKFGEVLDEVGGFLRQIGAPYAVVGGIALATLGIQRELMLLPGVDRDAIRESFARHGLLERYHDLAKFL